MAPATDDGSSASGGSPPVSNGGEGATVADWTGGSTGQGSAVGVGAGGFGSNGGLIIDPLTGGTGGTSEPKIADGGTVVLTAEEVTAIQGSECTGVSADAEQVPAVLQLVVDVSASMGDPAPGAEAGVNKWDITSVALLNAVDALPAEMAVGMQLYPTNPPAGFGGPGGMPGMPAAVGDCVDAAGQTPIDFLGAAGSAHRTALSTAIDGAVLVFGTPTHDGYMFALDESLKVTTVPGKKSMLLITDGAPTQELGCGPMINEGSPTQPIVDDIAAAYAEGVLTYVIGSPGSEQNEQTGQDMRAWLSQAALAGGTPQPGCAVEGPNFCHFDMTQAADFGAALAEGLAQISENVADLCTFEMPAPPDGMTSSLDLTSVIINFSNGTSELVQRDDIDVCTEGWKVNDLGQIVLCDATCARVEADKAAQATVSMGCDPAEIVVR